MQTSRLFSILNGLMAVTFLFAVAVQFNDPDPIQWMTIYGAALAACLIAYRKPSHWIFPAVVGIIALLWALGLTPDWWSQRTNFGAMFEEFEMKNETIELERETGGLLIVAVWMIVLTVRALMSRKQMQMEIPTSTSKKEHVTQ